MPIRAVTFHDEAGADYDSAFDWYLERSATAAIRFDEAVEQALTDIARTWRRFRSSQLPTPAVDPATGKNAF